MINKEALPEKEFKLIDEETGEFIGEMNTISIVDDPAIEKSFQFFGNLNKETDIAPVVSEERMEITGPAMIAEKRMLRQHPVTKKYFMAYFTAKQIRAARDYFMMYGNTKGTNLNHTNNFSSAFKIVEAWIIEDPSQDKANALGFKDLNKGDLYITFKVLDKTIWDKIKTSNYTGFSIEGGFGMYSEIALEKAIFNIVNDNNLNDSNKEKAIKDMLGL